MRSLVRLLLCAVVVSSPAQSWAAPMLCDSGMDSHAASAGHAHEGGHEDHTESHHDSSMHDPFATHDHSSSECASDCECGHCVVTVALSDNEHASISAYRGERVALYDSPHNLYLDNIFRPPISR